MPPLIPRFFPFLKRLPPTRKTLKNDVFSGVTVAMLLIPQSMAYAELAGLPPLYGLYTAFIPVILGALFGHMRQLASGPTAMTSIITAAVLSEMAAPGTLEYVHMAILLAFLVGIIRLFLGLFRLAALANLFSRPLIVGFTNAGALVITLSQTEKVLGLFLPRHWEILGSLRNTAELLRALPEVHLPSLILGLLTMGLILIMKKLRPRWPTIFLVIMTMTAVSRLVGFNPRWGGEVVGFLPRGLPSLLSPFAAWESPGKVILQLFPGALVVTLISFMEVLSISKVISSRTGQPLNLNQEMIGQGLAAVGGSFFQGYPAGGSFARSAMNLLTGAKTGWSSIISGIMAALALLFLTPLVYHLPQAVISAAIIPAVVRLIDFRSLGRMLKADRPGGIVSIFTFLATLATAPFLHLGVVLGMVLSIGVFLWGFMRSKVVVLGRHPDGTLKEAKAHGLPKGGSILILGFDDLLVFANSGNFEMGVLSALNAQAETKFLIIHAEKIHRIDASGEWALTQILRQTRAKGITMVLGGLSNQALETLKKSGLLEELSPRGYYSDTEKAIEAIHLELRKRNLHAGEP